MALQLCWRCAELWTGASGGTAWPLNTHTRASYQIILRLVQGAEVYLPRSVVAASNGQPWDVSLDALTMLLGGSSSVQFGAPNSAGAVAILHQGKWELEFSFLLQDLTYRFDSITGQCQQLGPAGHRFTTGSPIFKNNANESSNVEPAQ